jgi:signal transduction histidine kinase
MGIPVAVNVAGQSALPPEVQVALYRVCQEGLNNVARHANATRVEIDLQQKAGAVELHLCDNGRGFDPGQPPPAGHFGLAMMCERAAEAGLVLKLTSRPGQGTEIAISWKESPNKEAVKP